MKVLFDTTTLYIGNKSGIYYYTINLLKELLKIKDLELKKVALIREPKSDIATQLKALLKALKTVTMRQTLNLMYIPHPRLYAHIILQSAFALLDVPVVTTVHDVHFLVTKQPFGYKLKLLPRYLGITSSSKVIQNIYFTTVSYFTKANLVNMLGVKESKVVVIYPGVDDIFFTDIEQETAYNFVREIYGIKKPYVLYVGPIHPDKGVLRLIDAFKLARKRGLNASLVIAGPLRMPRDAFLKRLRECDNSIYLGYVPRDHLPYLYRATNVFVFLSIHEGFGLPVIEAAACGCPLIVSDIPTFREILRNAAFFVNPHDTEMISEALLLQDVIRPMGAIAKKRAEVFRWNKAAEKMVSYWRNIVEGIQ